MPAPQALLLLIGCALSQHSSAGRSTDLDLELDNSIADAALVSHVAGLALRFTKLNLTNSEVQFLLARHPEFREPLEQHFADVLARPSGLVAKNSSAVFPPQTKPIRRRATPEAAREYRNLNDLRRKLHQRARNSLLESGLAHNLERSMRSKTECRCFVEEVSFSGAMKLKLVDLDEEADSGYECKEDCFEHCQSEDKYKFDADKAELLGAEIGGAARKVAQCEDGECKCLDAKQSAERISNIDWILTALSKNHQPVELDVVWVPQPGKDLSEEPNRYGDEESCLANCGTSCQDIDKGDFGGLEVDFEAMCIDEWYD